jgi:hypothetical protein
MNLSWQLCQQPVQAGDISDGKFACRQQLGFISSLTLLHKKNISKQRKFLEANRVFSMKREEEYLLIENNGEPLCLVCQQTVSVVKEYNVRQHYETLHRTQYAQYVGKSRSDIVMSLKNKHQKQKEVLCSFWKPQTASLTDEVVMMLVKNRKSFRDGELIKQYAVKMAQVFGEEKVARKFESVSLSHQTVSRRVSELNEHVPLKLKDI